MLRPVNGENDSKNRTSRDPRFSMWDFTHGASRFHPFEISKVVRRTGDLPQIIENKRFVPQSEVWTGECSGWNAQDLSAQRLFAGELFLATRAAECF